MLVAENASKSANSVAYIRVSSQRQVDEGVSLEAQKRRIKEYARFKNLNLRDEDIIIERGVSGGIPIWDRPRGRVLKRKLASGQFPNLITMKLDRMFRLTTDMLNTIDDLNDAGIDLHIVDLNGEAVDTSTPMGRFFLTMMGAIAEMERGLISERTQEGMNQLRAANKRFTQSIYGWDVTEDGMLVPNWFEQDIIDFMDWQVNENGVSATSVANFLTKRGYRGKRGGKWNAGGVLRTIENDFHDKRLDFQEPKWWGTKPWHRTAK